LLTAPTLKAARAPSKTAMDCKKLDDIIWFSFKYGAMLQRQGFAA